jgi:very-short-patch-repair endonuclease
VQYFTIAVTGIIVLIITTILKAKFGDETSQKNTNFKEYEKIPYLLSKAENSFYNVLKLSVTEEYIICPKVRVADFVRAKKSKNWQANFNRISRKHIDFLICNKKMQTIYGVELDDKSHDKQGKRDEFINNLYKKINFPIVRVKADYTYSVAKLKEKINSTLNTNKETTPADVAGSNYHIGSKNVSITQR